MTKKSGFTLIELLIVIAIIAILALIAVPNFLEAQTRAKFSRSLADMRAICTAIDSLRMDTGYLPIDGWDDDSAEGFNILKNNFNNVGNFPEAVRSTTHYLAVLTSPVGYMNAIPADPFLPPNFDARAFGYASPFDSYLYVDRDPNIPGRNMDIQALISTADGGTAEKYGLKPLQLGEYAIMGLGPDKKFGLASASNVGGDRGLPYSPTNGTVSDGDVVMFIGARVNFE